MENKKILIIGDVMIDKYTYGIVKRLNPEGPNPLLNVTNEEYRLGGSANVAANVASLNDKSYLIGLVGNDDNANILNKICKNKDIIFNGIEIDNYKTILKQRFIETTYNQQLLRVDYEDTEINEKIINEMNKNILNIVNEISPDIIVISDYNKGIINNILIKELKKIGEEKNIILLADAKPKNYELFKDFFLIKPNFKEFKEMIGKNIKNNDKDVEKYGIEFVRKMNVNLVITRGAKGASLITKEGKYYHIKTEAQKIFDVSGAGDTFIATIAYALGKGYNLINAVKLGNKASGIVIEKVGTAIVEKNELFI